MANHQIAAENLEPNSEVVLRGQVQFSRVARPFEGAELARRVKQSRSMYPTDRPHTLLDVKNAEVLYNDPANPTINEQFINERRYTSTKNPDQGHKYTAENLGSILPTVFLVDDNGQATQVNPMEGEIARDTVVTVVLNIFDSGRPKKGVGIKSIFVHANEMPYANIGGGADPATLNRLGITISGPVSPTTSSVAGVPEQEASAGTDDDGLPQPGLGQQAQAAAQPASQTNQNYAPQQPTPANQGYVQQQPQQQGLPAQTTAPANQGYVQQPTPANQGYVQQPTPANQGYVQQQPQQPVNPAQPAQPQAASAFGNPNATQTANWPNQGDDNDHNPPVGITP